jgi:hypothetical protein
MAEQMVIGPYIASQLGRLQQALRDENEFNVSIVLAEAETLLTNPANQPLIGLEVELPSFELAVFRLWSTVKFGVLDAHYDSSVDRRARALNGILSDMIRERMVMVHCRPSAVPGDAAARTIDLDTQPL